MSNILDFLEFLPIFFIALFFSILFLQSAFDKLIDYHGNLAFLNDHFKKTCFQNLVKLLFATITLLEFLSGIFSLVGLVFLVGVNTIIGTEIILLAVILSNLTLCCLFLGQRIAKDYVGAASLVPYLLIGVLSFLFF